MKPIVACSIAVMLVACIPMKKDDDDAKPVATPTLKPATPLPTPVPTPAPGAWMWQTKDGKTARDPLNIRENGLNVTPRHNNH